MTAQDVIDFEPRNPPTIRLWLFYVDYILVFLCISIHPQEVGCFDSHFAGIFDPGLDQNFAPYSVVET